MSQEHTDLPGDEQTPAVSGTPEAAGKHPETPPETPAPEAARTDQRAQSHVASGAQTTAPEADEEQVAALREALQQASDEADRYRDQALRAVAEAENVRKRAQRDVESARKFALEKFAAELLGVRDSLELGLKAGEKADSGKLVEGMEITGRMLASAMEKFGVEVINPEGEAFDPELHEAVSTQPTDEQAPNTVVAVVQKGYTLNGRVLRAAMVVVAKPAGGNA